MKILDNINSYEDFKKLDENKFPELAHELRHYIFDIIKKNGGHLASNFGVIELSIALLKVFNFPEDKIIWDVGHQSYIYKILTGRRDQFKNIRLKDGISGFPNINESEFDSFTTGHASTSLSVGLGLALARDINKQKHNVISVIGDGALTGGISFEALNAIGEANVPMIIVLNDNNMSISNSVGGISKILDNLRIKRKYILLKKNISQKVKRFPLIGRAIYKIMDSSKDVLKRIFVKDLIFNYFKIKYIGGIDGHDLKKLVSIFNEVKDYTEPVVLHITTKKGKGLIEAENNPNKFHGISSERELLQNYPSFSNKLGDVLCDFAEKNENIVAVTAAMIDGTGLRKFFEYNDEKLFDVGIAEQNAVTMSAGLAKGGVKPYCAIYSTFLQRAYDSIVHDVCLNDLPVVFCIDRAGVVGSDGITHNGLLDISFLRNITNLSVYAPKNVSDFEKILNFSLTYNHPLAIRYPKNCLLDYETSYSVRYGKWEKLEYNNDSTITILAVGDRMIDLALKTKRLLISENIDINVVNACFIKPLDKEMLNEIWNHYVITLEDGIVGGGFGESVLSYYNSKYLKTNVDILGFKSCYIEHGTVEELFISNELTEEKLINLIKNAIS